MPIGHYVDPGQFLIICRLFDRVAEHQLLEMLAQVGRETDKPGVWHSLIVFDEGLDMSGIGVVDMERVRARHEQMYRHPGVSRGTGAAVVPAGDGEIIMPFYNALCGDSEELRQGFRVFAEIPPALEWLGIDKESGLEMVARTALRIAA